VDGRPVRTRNPIEIVSTRRELHLLHEGLRRAGRPGMGMLAAQSSVSELVDLPAAQARYLRPCDSHLVTILNELKMDFRNISRAVNSLEYGMVNASLPCVIVGGLGGGPVGSAVVNVASFLIASPHPWRTPYPASIHIRHVATSPRRIMGDQHRWAGFRQKLPGHYRGGYLSEVRAGTKELLYETAANAIVNAVTASHLEGCGSSDRLNANCSGLEALDGGVAGFAPHAHEPERSQ
jgi:methylamine--corrinoid protein Co-methyltransferase